MRWRIDIHNIFLIAITLLLGASGIFISGIPQAQMNQGRWVAHTHEVLHRLAILSGEISEAHADQNAYLSTHSVESRDDYGRVVGNINNSMDSLAILVQDNAVQQVHIAPLRQALADRFADISGNPASINNEDVLQRLEIIRKEEQRLLEEREKNWNKSMRTSRFVFLGGIGVVYGLVLFAYGVSRKEVRIRDQLLQLESKKLALQRIVAERMAKVVEVQQDIISHRLDLQVAMDVITRRIQEITAADGVVIEMLEGKDMVYRAASGIMSTFVGTRLKTEGSLSGLSVASGFPLRCDDSETDTRVDRKTCRKIGLRSMIVVPLVHHDEVAGVLKLASARTNGFTAEDESTLQLMAGILFATLRDATEAEELKNRADTDGMTGLKNHRFFQECLNQEYARASRHNGRLSLIMCDVDYFKKYNDEFGHQSGDMVLKQVAGLLKGKARPSDHVARYGGEEFAIILTETPLADAVLVANRICEAVRKAPWPQRAVTISMGVSGMENGSANPMALVEEADKALYESKRAGRDRVTAYAVKKS